MPEPEGIVYREARPDDVPSLAGLRLPDEAGGASRERMALYLSGHHHPQRALLPRVMYVADGPDGPVGYVAGHRTRRFDCDGELQWIYVRAEQRGRGVADRLLRLLADWFVAHDARSVCVDVGDPRAVGFYARHGARPLEGPWMVWDDIVLVTRGGLECRPAIPADAEAIREVAEEGWWATYRGIVPDEVIRARLDDWYSIESLHRTITDPRSTFFVACRGEWILGYAHAVVGPRGPELFRLYVRPERWRSGVGSALLDVVEAALREEGIDVYRCRVHRANEIGQAFYRRRGWVREPLLDDDEHFGLARTL